MPPHAEFFDKLDALAHCASIERVELELHQLQAAAPGPMRDARRAALEVDLLAQRAFLAAARKVAAGRARR